MRKVETDHLELIGKGVTASVYLYDEHNVIKVFRDVVPKAEIQHEYDCAKLVENLGIRTPAARAIVETDQGIGIIYERVRGITLSEEMQQDKSKLYEYGVQYGEQVRNIHEKNVRNAPIPKAGEAFKGLFDHSADFVSADEKEELEGYIDLVPQADCLLHGDIAPVNIMVQDGHLIIIDVPTVMAGHPVFDLLQPFTFCQETTKLFGIFMAMSEEEKNSPVGRFLSRFEARYLDQEQSETVWQGFLKGYFGEAAMQKRDVIEYTLNFYNSIKFMGSSAMRAKFGDEVVQFLTDYGRSWLQNNKQKMVCMDFSIWNGILNCQSGICRT